MKPTDAKKEGAAESAAETAQDKLAAAKESYQKLKDQIAPYVKRRRFVEYSTAGEWLETSSLYHRA